ncbi:protein ORF14 [Lake sturgeon herpesvirus]|nr:protein ORF14 [Lake sturgeon herpesvirus]
MPKANDTSRLSESALYLDDALLYLSHLPSVRARLKLSALGVEVPQIQPQLARVRLKKRSSRSDGDSASAKAKADSFLKKKKKSQPIVSDDSSSSDSEHGPTQAKPSQKRFDDDKSANPKGRSDSSSDSDPDVHDSRLISRFTKKRVVFGAREKPAICPPKNNPPSATSASFAAAALNAVVDHEQAGTSGINKRLPLAPVFKPPVIVEPLPSSTGVSKGVSKGASKRALTEAPTVFRPMVPGLRKHDRSTHKQSILKRASDDVGQEVTVIKKKVLRFYQTEDQEMVNLQIIKSASRRRIKVAKLPPMPDIDVSHNIVIDQESGNWNKSFGSAASQLSNLTNDHERKLIFTDPSIFYNLPSCASQMPNAKSIKAKEEMIKKPQVMSKIYQCNKNASSVNFVFGQSLGSGSYGRVYALQNFDKIAVKAMVQQNVKVADIVAATEEVLMACSLTHPFINRCYGAGIVTLKLYTLAFMERATLDVGEMTRDSEAHKRYKPHFGSFERQTLSALDYLHARGITHRDVSINNILIIDRPLRPVAKLADFGTMSNTISTLSSYICTMCFSAPETLYMRLHGHTADIWSWFCVFYAIHTHKMLIKVNTTVDQYVQDMATLVGMYQGKEAKLEMSRVCEEAEMNQLMPHDTNLRKNIKENILAKYAPSYYTELFDSIITLYPQDRPSARELLDKYYGGPITKKEMADEELLIPNFKIPALFKCKLNKSTLAPSILILPETLMPDDPLYNRQMGVDSFEISQKKNPDALYDIKRHTEFPVYAPAITPALAPANTRMLVPVMSPLQQPMATPLNPSATAQDTAMSAYGTFKLSAETTPIQARRGRVQTKTDIISDLNPVDLKLYYNQMIHTKVAGVTTTVYNINPLLAVYKCYTDANQTSLAASQHLRAVMSIGLHAFIVPCYGGVINSQLLSPPLMWFGPNNQKAVSLKEYLATHTLSDPDKLILQSQLWQAIESMHKRNVVTNGQLCHKQVIVLPTIPPRLQLNLWHTAINLTTAGDLLPVVDFENHSTKHMMAPEVLFYHKGNTKEADVWGGGLICWMIEANTINIISKDLSGRELIAYMVDQLPNSIDSQVRDQYAELKKDLIITPFNPKGMIAQNTLCSINVRPTASEVIQTCFDQPQLTVRFMPRFPLNGDFSIVSDDTNNETQLEAQFQFFYGDVLANNNNTPVVK